MMRSVTSVERFFYPQPVLAESHGCPRPTDVAETRVRLVRRRPNSAHDRAPVRAPAARAVLLADQLVQLRHDRVELLLEHRIAIERVLPHLLIDARRHAGKVR